MMGRQSGFTIIEVILFIAISATLFLIGANYMNATIRNVRFHDGIKATESLVEKQFSDVQTNSVNRPVLPAGKGLECSLDPTGSFTLFELVDAGDGASNTCIILGVALRFENTHVNIYPVVGTDDAPALGNALRTTRPTIYDGETDDAATPRGPIETFELPWQAAWTNTANPARPGRYMVGGTPQYFSTLAFLRSPDSEGVSTYVAEPIYDTDGSVLTVSRGHLQTVTGVAARINTRAVFCSTTDTSNALRGAVLLDGAGGTSNNFSISSISSRIVPIDEPLLGGLNCA